ncbi:Zinc finger protein 845 [Plakobranchus ocellatus]|uniref:Zinc finger protein 865 n=1 Tax=Plakobranchus ocellatus TaxID=259542 RepID=A0AAV4AQH2_9GAST|nr:Zinc finger protein 845 [Plakobranchus ocellatus]
MATISLASAVEDDIKEETLPNEVKGSGMNDQNKCEVNSGNVLALSTDSEAQGSKTNGWNAGSNSFCEFSSPKSSWNPESRGNLSVQQNDLEHQYPMLDASQPQQNCHNGAPSACMDKASKISNISGDVVHASTKSRQDSPEQSTLTVHTSINAKGTFSLSVDCDVLKDSNMYRKETMKSKEDVDSTIDSSNLNKGTQEGFRASSVDEEDLSNEETMTFLQCQGNSATHEIENTDRNESTDTLYSCSIPEIQTRGTKPSRFQLTVKLYDENSPEAQSTLMNERFACGQCPRTFKFATGLRRHMTKCHAKTKKLVCDTCAKVFPSMALLTKHMSSHIGLDLAPQTKKSTSFKCSQCSFAAGTRKNLKKHILVHTTKKEHKCPHCSFSSKRKNSLQRHLRATHSEFQCHFCNFKTASINSMRIHAVLHVASQSTACIVCGAILRKRASLLEHLMGHTEDENLTCKVCKKRFSLSHEFLLHLWCHRDTLLAEYQTKDLDIRLPGENKTHNGHISSFEDSMERAAMETKISELNNQGSKLVKMAKAVSFLNEKSKILSELTEISDLATELAVLSSNVLLAFKKSHSVCSAEPKKVRRAAAVVASNLLARTADNKNETVNHMENNDEEANDLPDSTTSIKEELRDITYSPNEDAGMQIQVDLKGEPVSCIQRKDSILKPGSFKKIKNEKGKRVLQCTRCNKVFKDTRSLRHHVMIHDNIRPYACTICSQSFRRKEHLKKHMVTHSDSRPFACSQCPYTAKTEQRLKIHYLSHLQCKSHKCTLCPYTSRTQTELNTHMKRHQPRTCTQCDFVCHTRIELKRHLLTHTTLSCPDCNFTTSDQTEYAKHKRKHREIHLLCCELCGYSCNTMKKFKYHKLRHENKTPYQCEDCDYKCSSRASYDCHRLKHAGLKPYLCSFCGAAFRKTSHLNQHLLIHKDEKAYKCSQCGYSCRTKHNLKEHEMTHSGEKPFSCKYCNFSCRRNKALQIHMAKHESKSSTSVSTISTFLQVQGPPPYPVNLVVPPVPSLPSIQLSSEMQMHQPMQVPLQMPLVPTGM